MCSELCSTRATLDEGPRFRVQWNRAILLAESHECNPWPLDEVPKPKSGKLKLIHGTISGGKSIGSDPNKRPQRRADDSENQDAIYGSKVVSNWRIQFASNESKLIPTNLDTGYHLKWALVRDRGLEVCYLWRFCTFFSSYPLAAGSCGWNQTHMWFPRTFGGVCFLDSRANDDGPWLRVIQETRETCCWICFGLLQWCWRSWISDLEFFVD